MNKAKRSAKEHIASADNNYYRLAATHFQVFTPFIRYLHTMPTYIKADILAKRVRLLYPYCVYL